LATTNTPAMARKMNPQISFDLSMSALHIELVQRALYPLDRMWIARTELYQA
jgi:hypothetical protein